MDKSSDFFIIIMMPWGPGFESRFRLIYLFIYFWNGFEFGNKSRFDVYEAKKGGIGRRSEADERKKRSAEDKAWQVASIMSYGTAASADHVCAWILRHLQEGMEKWERYPSDFDLERTLQINHGKSSQVTELSTPNYHMKLIKYKISRGWEQT